MKKSSQIKNITIYTLFLFFIVPILFLNPSHAASNGESLTIYNNCEMSANSNVQGILENVSSIDITLPSSDWNLTNIELNFTNIQLEREIKVIENSTNGFASIYHTNPSQYVKILYVQLNLSVDTKIFGLYIYGNRLSSTIENITFQIQGIDNSTFIPEGPIYGSIPLNMSSSTGWYLQDFSSTPILLPKGNYALVINATERDYTGFSGDILYWFHSGSFPPLTPYLHYGELKKSGTETWNVYDDITLLHKVVQKVNRTYDPEDINMSVVINGDSYEIDNNLALGGGNLSVNYNYHITNNQINFEVSNNQSIQISFSVNYSILFDKIQNQPYSFLVRENYDNSWNFEFSTDKTGFDYYELLFNYSRYDLEDIIIYRDDDDITSLPSVLNETGKIITLSNATIPESISSWEITASSEKISNLLLDYPESLLEIQRDQSLDFTINAPQGNLTIIMINSNGFEKNRDTLEHSGGDYDYTYLIPTNAHEGTWKAYVYWNNATSAGVITQSFTVIVPFTITPEVIINVVIIIAACLVVGGSSLQTVRVAKKRYEDKKKNLLNIFGDILNIDYFMISEKKTGLNIYEQKLGKGKPDALLITGYLDAISSFEIALTSSDERSQAIKLEFKNSKIIMSEFKGFRITLIMKQDPSKYILNSIEKLSYEINDKYGKFFENFNGQLKPFKGIDKIIENNLRMYLTYPFRVAHLNIESLKKTERVIIKRAIDLLNVMEYFYIIFLIPENQWNYRDLKTIFKLIDKKIFISIKGEVEGKKKLKQ